MCIFLPCLSGYKFWVPHILDKALVQYGWITWDVTDTNPDCRNVIITVGELKTVATVRMLVSDVVDRFEHENLIFFSMN